MKYFVTDLFAFGVLHHWSQLYLYNCHAFHLLNKHPAALRCGPYDCRVPAFPPGARQEEADPWRYCVCYLRPHLIRVSHSVAPFSAFRGERPQPRRAPYRTEAACPRGASIAPPLRRSPRSKVLAPDAAWPCGCRIGKHEHACMPAEEFLSKRISHSERREATTQYKRIKVDEIRARCHLRERTWRGVAWWKTAS